MARDENDSRTTAEIKKLGFGSPDWMVVLHDGKRGGIAFPSKRAAEDYCASRNYRVVKGETHG